MKKKLIHGKYIEKLDLIKGGIFVMKPDYILTSSTMDLLNEMDIKIVYGCHDETINNLKYKVIKILKEDYGIEKEEVTQRILKKLVREVNEVEY